MIELLVLFNVALVGSLFGAFSNGSDDEEDTPDGETGSPGDDLLYGTDGADTLIGNGGDDTLLGGTGNDLLQGDDGRDTVFAGEGRDTLHGGEGNDRLIGGPTGDTLLGGDGTDSLVLEGADIATGGEGDDIFIAEGFAAQNEVPIITDFTLGEDQLIISLPANTPVTGLITVAPEGPDMTRVELDGQLVALLQGAFAPDAEIVSAVIIA